MVLAAVSAVSTFLGATLAVSGALLSNFVLSHALDPTPDEAAELSWLAGALCAPGTLVTALLCGWRCIRSARDRDAAQGASISWGLAGGVIAPVLVALTLVGVQLVEGGGSIDVEHLLSMALVTVVAAVMVGGFVGTPVGLAFGAIMIRPIRLGCEHRWAHDSLERAVTVCGGWLACVSGGVGVLLILLAMAVSPVLASFALTLSKAWAAIGVVGVLAFLWGGRRSARRARWLARVRAGAERGWAVVELDEEAARIELGLRPFQGGEPTSARFALARLEPVPGGAYREVDHPVPVALVAAG